MVSGKRTLLTVVKAAVRSPQFASICTRARTSRGKSKALEASVRRGRSRRQRVPYRKAWLLVEDLNRTLNEPAVTAETGGVRGVGATLTPVGESVVRVLPVIELQVRTAAGVSRDRRIYSP
jgi:molybdate transport system regulatory protein